MLHLDNNTEREKERDPFLIGIAGGTGSGKMSVLNKITQKLGVTGNADSSKQVAVIGQGGFYKELSDEDRKKASQFVYNFDHPSAFDFKCMYDTLLKLSRGESVYVYDYDFRNNSRSGRKLPVLASDVVICEGILLFHRPEIRDLFHMKLFVDTDSDVRLAARVRRDVKEFGRDIQNVLRHYEHFVKPAYDLFCLATKQYADVIIPRGAENTVAIDLIAQHVRDLLRARRTKRSRRQSERLDRSDGSGSGLSSLKTPTADRNGTYRPPGGDPIISSISGSGAAAAKPLSFAATAASVGTSQLHVPHRPH